MKNAKSLTKMLIHIPIWLACLSLFILMVMTFSDVILRSTFDAPIEAATEMTRILVAIMVFSVMPYISVSNGHIAVDLTDGFFEKYGLTRYRDAAIFIMSAVILIWPALRVIQLAERTRSYGDVTEYLSIPQYLVMWFVGISVSITVIAILINGIFILFGRRDLGGFKS